MLEFRGIASFVTHLAEVAVAQAEVQEAALDEAAELIQKAAKAKIGDYQPGASPFVEWAPLADSTVEEKERLGYGGQVSEDDPLLREGDLRDSIERNSDVTQAFVGSDSDIAMFQELGTARIPPRSFLGSAAVEQTPKVLEIVGDAVALSLIGEYVTAGTATINSQADLSMPLRTP